MFWLRRGRFIIITAWPRSARAFLCGQSGGWWSAGTRWRTASRCARVDGGRIASVDRWGYRLEMADAAWHRDAAVTLLSRLASVPPTDAMLRHAEAAQRARGRRSTGVTPVTEIARSEGGSSSTPMVVLASRVDAVPVKYWRSPMLTRARCWHRGRRRRRDPASTEGCALMRRTPTRAGDCVETWHRSAARSDVHASATTWSTKQVVAGENAAWRHRGSPARSVPRSSKSSISRLRALACATVEDRWWL